MEAKQYIKTFSLLCMLALTACYPIKHWPEKQALVIDVETNKPLEGVIVVAFWNGTGGGSHAQSICYHTESATTDAAGKFIMPSFNDGFRQSFVANKGVARYLYKPGYKEYVVSDSLNRPYEKMEIYRMVPFKGTREERLEYLKLFPTNCDEADDSNKTQLLIKRKLYEEAKRIAVTKKDKDIVEILLFGLESLEFDDNTAHERMIKRREAGK